MSKQKKINQLKERLCKAERVIRSLERSNEDLALRLEQSDEIRQIEADNFELQNKHLLKVASGVVALNPCVTYLLPNE